MRIHKNPYPLKRPLQSFAAVVLLLVFLLTPFVEAFHHHTQPELKTRLSRQSKDADRTQIKTYSFCKICDYLQHAGHHHATTGMAQYTVYLPVVILKIQATAPRIIPALILSYANKGPPTV